MVGRFVQNQEIWWIEQHPGHDQARLLAAGQNAAGLFNIIAGKTEASRKGAQRALARLGKGAIEGLKNGLFALQHIHGVLSEIAHPDIGADADRALIGRNGPRHELQKRRFAGAIGAQDAPAFLSTHQKVEILIDRLVAITLVNLANIDHVVARPGRALELELNRLATTRRLDPFNLVDLLHAALDLGGV